MKKEKAFQDYFPGGMCFGCGPANKFLKIKSYWISRECGETICNWRIKKGFSEITGKYLHGGTAFSLMDCHSIWTAVAARYDLERRPFGSEPVICYVTAGAENFRISKRIPLDSKALTVLAKVKETSPHSRKCLVEASIWVKGEKCAEVTIVAVRVDLLKDEIQKIKMT